MQTPTKHSHSSPSTLKADLHLNRSYLCNRPSASLTSIWTNQTRPSTIKQQWRNIRKHLWTANRPQAFWGVRSRHECKIRFRCQSPLIRWARFKLQPRWALEMISRRFCRTRVWKIYSWQLTVNSLSRSYPSTQWRRSSQTIKSKTRNWREKGTSECWALETRPSFLRTWGFQR